MLKSQGPKSSLGPCIAPTCPGSDQGSARESPLR
eukprot:CAMPEP_0195056114 /NCGR_PEP_ID=MMETSP0448-20130528/4657_1 /TAXON_ID=66468 /ORGANISM="Heterocapsa triquestra, Strain CCMP 448" /LENGTH=33 /DNA_ID= /DNA_START= /DNA_END= /DNA_ORIENTATION=